MGCTSSVTASGTSPIIKHRRSTASVSSIDVLDGYDENMVKKREGHPSNFSFDGYDIGLRVKV